MQQILPIHYLKITLIGILFLSHFNLKAQKEFDGRRGTQHWMMFSDAPNALYHHLADQAYGYLGKRSSKVANLHSLQDWQQRQDWIRTTLSKAVGPFPEKTPLNPQITKVVQKDDYRIENIIYASQPGYYVTSSLFIPTPLKKGKKAPVVIYCSGHSSSGYRSRTYQRTIINLVKKGFVVFAIDPMGQGERLQYYDPRTGESRFRWPSYEHSYAGAQLFITGNTLARNFIWDGIRAVDYLLTRKEVDPKRIGITGRSGGGTQSAFIAAFDDRIKALASGNYFTNFTRLYQSMGPQDAEQNFFYGIARGLDMADLLVVRAPKPALMITTSRDMFPVQGAIETTAEVTKIYKAYGREDEFYRVSDDAPHASTKKNREAMYAFFQKHLNNPGDPTDEDIEYLKEELQVTETGQLATSLKGETAFSLNKKDAEKRMLELEKARKNRPEYFGGVLNAARELSGYREPEQIEEPVFVGRIQRDGYTVEKYFVKGEGDYVIPYLLMEPEASSDKALLYIHPLGKVAGSDEGGEMEWFVKKGYTVLAPDIIGTGEMGPGQFRGDSYIDSVSYNLWFASMLVGRSIIGIQAGDIVRLTRLLKENYGIEEISGLARREMAPVLLHAAVFDNSISRVALVDPYASYRALVMTQDYHPEFLHSAVPGAIGIYDLPDLAGNLAPRKLMIWHPTDGAGNSGNPDAIAKDLSVIESAYQYRKAADQLQVVPTASSEELRKAYEKWIEN